MFRVMKGCYPELKCGSLINSFLDNNGGVWHRVSYTRLWLHTKYLLVGSIHCWSFHGKKNIEYVFKGKVE